MGMCLEQRGKKRSASGLTASPTRRQAFEKTNRKAELKMNGHTPTYSVLEPCCCVSTLSSFFSNRSLYNDGFKSNVV